MTSKGSQQGEGWAPTFVNTKEIMDGKSAFWEGEKAHHLSESIWENYSDLSQGYPSHGGLGSGKCPPQNALKIQV